MLAILPALISTVSQHCDHVEDEGNAAPVRQFHNFLVHLRSRSRFSVALWQGQKVRHNRRYRSSHSASRRIGFLRRKYFYYQSSTSRSSSLQTSRSVEYQRQGVYFQSQEEETVEKGLSSSRNYVPLFFAETRCAQMEPVLTVYVSTPDKSMTLARSRQEVYDLDRKVRRNLLWLHFSQTDYSRFSYDWTSLIVSRHSNTPPHHRCRRNEPSSLQSLKPFPLVDRLLLPAPRSSPPSSQSTSPTSPAISPTPRPMLASDPIRPGKHSSPSDWTISNPSEWSVGSNEHGARSFI